jgi:CRISPR/Cas system CSM-associated protein Csm3 (group 7 of RAMP superfamily)
MTVSTWYGRKTRQIGRRTIIEGELVLQTPAHFGNGDGDEVTDMPLLLDPYDNQSPLLTGASLAGALRSYLREHGGQANGQSASVLLFGGGKGDDGGEQSPLIVADSLGQKANFTIRAGVRLEGKTRTAADKALFDVQLWQAGTTFLLRFELLVCQQFKKGKENQLLPFSDEEQAQYETELKQALATALAGLSNGGITLGARKRRGYGEVQVSQWRVKEHDLTNPTQLCDWLANGNQALEAETAVADLQSALSVSTLLTDNRQLFTLNAIFALQGSLLIRSGEGRDDVGPDMVHLHARQPNGKKAPIVSGTSLAGALRARAQRIVNTIQAGDGANQLINSLFGGEYQRDGKKRLQASRLSVKEKVVANGRTDLVQNRVSIDRFTGGARETALFNQQPVFAQEETLISVDLNLRNPQAYDMGLLLLLLKDLWTEDLPLGGESSVGRGRLQGRRAELAVRNGEMQEWVITAASPNQINFEKGEPAALQKFVDALHTQLTGGQS